MLSPKSIAKMSSCNMFSDGKEGGIRHISMRWTSCLSWFCWTTLISERTVCILVKMMTLTNESPKWPNFTLMHKNIPKMFHPKSKLWRKPFFNHHKSHAAQNYFQLFAPWRWRNWNPDDASNVNRWTDRQRQDKHYVYFMHTRPK